MKPDNQPASPHKTMSAATNLPAVQVHPYREIAADVEAFQITEGVALSVLLKESVLPWELTHISAEWHTIRRTVYHFIVEAGGQRAHIGDWIIRRPNGSLEVRSSHAFSSGFEGYDAMLAARKEGRPPTASYPPAPVSDLGDAVADMFDQLVKGNWIDDHGHPVANNAAMIRLKERLESLMGHIAAARGKEASDG